MSTSQLPVRSIPGTLTSTCQFDDEGLDLEGFDWDGYDCLGFDRKGYDRGSYASRPPRVDGTKCKRCAALYGSDGYDATGRDWSGHTRKWHLAVPQDPLCRADRWR